MIRLTLALLATMFLTFMVAGADRGQVRYGLMATDSTPVMAETVTPETVATAEPVEPVEPEPPVVDAIYVPSQPLIVAPEVQPAQPEPVAEVQPEPAPPAEPEKRVMFINVSTANVREGPSTDFSVLDKLSRGEAVTVIAADADPEGWTLIKIEGDGVEGYVSSALLADQP